MRSDYDETFRSSPMVRITWVWLGTLLLVTGLLAGCGDGSGKPAATVSDVFESGSIGTVTKVNDAEWELSIRNDNDNPDLPASWRSWWYVKMEHLATNAPIQFTIKNSGWPFYYVPVYSYDRKSWNRFNEDEVTQNLNNEIVVRKRFEHGSVWIARFYPYTFTDLQHYLNSIKGNPHVEIRIPGYSQEGRPVYALKITDASVPLAGKKRVFMHARTHAAETSPSFLLEGMIQHLLSGTPEAAALLASFEWYIFPMQNVDGVVAGNYRSTPKSENLEMSWTFDSAHPLDLIGYVPPEVAVIHQYAKDLMSDGGPPITMALNLHASNSEPDIRTFFYPHFGTTAQGYTALEALLWDKQLRFIDRVAARHGIDKFEPIPEEGGGSFAGKTYPESWWWANFQDQVMAMTMEMTYGRAGYAPRWIEPADMRQLGVSLARGIHDYYDVTLPAAASLPRAPGVTGKNRLKYPELYPPHAADELKE
jgi:hypothetical protein